MATGFLKFDHDHTVYIDLDLATDEVKKAVIIDADDVETPICGGGSSDFSTATLTVNNNNGSTVYLGVPYILTIDGQGSVGAGRLALEEGTSTVSVILYKGKTTILTSDYNVTTTGNIEVLKESFYLITGDAALTITGSGGDDNV